MQYLAYAKQSVQLIPLDTQYLLLDRLYTDLYTLDILEMYCEDDLYFCYGSGKLLQVQLI